METPPLSWFETFVDTLPQKAWFRFLSNWVIVPFWNWRDPKPRLEGGPRPALQPSENLQRMMNLVMPLSDPSPIGRTRAAMAIAQNTDEIFGGLDNVGTVHTARFVLIGDYLCMLSVYDGNFSNYIRDFIVAVGSVFDAVMELVEGGDKLIPTAHHVEEFIAWVHDHDLFQVPDFPTDLFALQDAARGLGPDAPPHALRSLSREMILQFNANPNVSLGGGYRAYPGISAAQLRQMLGVGW